MSMPSASVTVIEDTQESAVSWGAILAGGIAAAAITLFLLALGTGLGFAIVSPWSDSGVSATTFTWTAALYLIVVAMISSTIGGLIAGWLRTRWTGIDADRAYFRDTVHGFLAWAVATVFGAALLGGAATHLLSGATQGLASAAPGAAAQIAGSSNDIYIDRLLRPDANANIQPGDQNAVRAELSRLFTNSLRRGSEFTPADRTYLAQVVARRTGLSQEDAERRVNEVVTNAKTTADTARRALVKLSLWFAGSLLLGAFCASLAATEGGKTRDRR
ncbi:MAG: hypothetical protein AB7K04_10210 [Pseudorhodoplanes sp.]